MPRPSRLATPGALPHILAMGTKDEKSLIKYSVIAEDYNGRDVKSAAAMAELTYLITVGLEALIRYDKWDPNSDVENDELHIDSRTGIFSLQFVEIKTQYRFHIEEPKVDNNAVVLQFHFWY